MFNYFQNYYRYFLIQVNYKNFIKNYEIIDLYNLKTVIKTEQEINNIFNPLLFLSNISNLFINYPISTKINFYANNTLIFNINFKYINQVIINKIFIIEDKFNKNSIKEIEKKIFKIKLPQFFNIFKNFFNNLNLEITNTNNKKFIIKQEKIVNYLLYEKEKIICSYYKTNDINKIIQIFYSIQELKNKYSKEDLLKNILINRNYFLITLNYDIKNLIENYTDDIIYLIFGLPIVIDILT
ncbi:MAG: hypothetical protein ACP5O4_06465 [bacterium]